LCNEYPHFFSFVSWVLVYFILQGFLYFQLFYKTFLVLFFKRALNHGIWEFLFGIFFFLGVDFSFLFSTYARASGTIACWVYSVEAFRFTSCSFLVFTLTVVKFSLFCKVGGFCVMSLLSSLKTDKPRGAWG